MNNYETYESPFCTRYTSSEMKSLFSAQKKFSTFRRLWTALARAEMKLGLNVTAQQVAQLQSHIDDIDFAAAEKYERETRHDVMAHIKAYGDVCPDAAGIIHLGATSCYVGDNTDIIIMRDALNIIKAKLLGVIKNLADFAEEHKALPCLAYTHLQPAQPTTVGKRATLWLYDLVTDLDEIDFRLKNLKLLGQKGTTGTQASFVELFGGDTAKIDELEREIAKEMGFAESVPVSGQTYSRKVDANITATLSAIAQSAYKFGCDLRILANFKEMEEPFEKNQIGSSAMPYKRNPMRCERMCSLSRYIITNAASPALTAASQWFERTLDDSANKRIAVAEAFLAADAVLNIFLNVTDGIKVYPTVVTKRLTAELPFMATENIMMDAVKRGGNRQELHEKIRVHSLAAAERVKEGDGVNDLPERIASDPAFGVTLDDVNAVLKPANFVGRSVEQTENFLNTVVKPLLRQNSGLIKTAAELTV
ncbi:MAG: adenylosuccinate lyase [Oscillospiraceae bacterium]|nr:adenylosuccinate lyase [Oscillospiraceae bacterium]